MIGKSFPDNTHMFLNLITIPQQLEVCFKVKFLWLDLKKSHCKYSLTSWIKVWNPFLPTVSNGQSSCARIVIQAFVMTDLSSFVSFFSLLDICFITESKVGCLSEGLSGDLCLVRVDVPVGLPWYFETNRHFVHAAYLYCFSSWSTKIPNTFQHWDFVEVCGLILHYSDFSFKLISKQFAIMIQSEYYYNVSLLLSIWFWELTFWALCVINADLII